MSRRTIQINIIIMGHVNSGKSTSIGHLIYNSTNIDKKIFQELEKESNKMYNNQSKYTWILEKLKAKYECECDNLFDMSLWKFETTKNCITIMDVPGHCNFIKNMITNATRANCVMLIVSASTDEFEIGISENGQTFQHIQLAQILGIDQMIIAINKMDTTEPSFSQQRFEEIKKEIFDYLKKIEYQLLSVVFIPISGLYGDNLVIPSENMPWFAPWNIQHKEESIKGTTIFEALDAIIFTYRLIDKPLRLSLNDIYKIGGIGTVPVGRVATGVLKPNMIVNFAPSNLSSRVKSIEMGRPFDEVTPGDYTGFSVEHITVKELQRGFVCSDAKNNPAEEAISFIAYITILNHPRPINQGYRSMLCCHTARVMCEFSELIKKVNRRSGKIIENAPKNLKSKEAALVRITPLNPICVEKFAEYPPLGRFVIRDMEQGVIVGVIVDVEKKATATRESRKK